MEKAVVLLSGGLDSCTCMAVAKSKGYEVYPISFNYHQRHSIELEGAKKIAAYYGVKKHLIIEKLSHRGRDGRNATVSIARIPE